MCLARDGEKRKRERGVLKRMYVQAIRVLARFRDTLTFFLFNCCFFFFFYFFLFSDYFLLFFFHFPCVVRATRGFGVCSIYLHFFCLYSYFNFSNVYAQCTHKHIKFRRVFDILYVLCTATVFFLFSLLFARFFCNCRLKCKCCD